MLYFYNFIGLKLGFYLIYDIASKNISYMILTY